jgi:hypothetical protein
VVRGGGAAFFAEQVPPPCLNGGRWFDISARLPTRIWGSAKIPLQDFFGQCQHTDLIGLWWAILGLPTGTDGVSSQWQRVEATPLRVNSASTRSYSGIELL